MSLLNPAENCLSCRTLPFVLIHVDYACNGNIDHNTDDDEDDADDEI